MLGPMNQLEMPNPFRMSGVEFISYSKFMTQSGKGHVNIIEACRFTLLVELDGRQFGGGLTLRPGTVLNLSPAAGIKKHCSLPENV